MTAGETTPMPHTATTLSSWVRAICRAVDDAGSDSAALLQRAGMDPRLLEDPDARYPLAQTTRLWALAREATGDEAIGLRVASAVRQSTFHALGHSLPASATLKEAFERIERYFRIVTSAGEMQFARRGSEYHLLIDTPETGPQPAPEAIDAFVSVYVRMCRAFAGRQVSPLRIALQRPAPREPQRFAAVLRAPIAFDADSNRLVFDRATMERPLEDANPELALQHEAIAQRYLARFDTSNIVTRVEATLVDQLPHGEPSQKSVAEALHLSARSLQRRLAEAGSSYTEVRDNARRELALRYLREGSHSISEITYLLGFSDTSSFARACRRWTGSAPSALRGDQGASTAA